MKAGYKTTEFWLTLAVQVMAVLVTLGVITPEQQSIFADSLEKILGALVMAISAGSYAISRGFAKKNQ